jgi:hypothetical protein
MSKIRSIVFAVSICTISVGLVVIAGGAILLRRLDQHMCEHAVDFYDLARRYDSITSAGAPACLLGCFGVALALGYKDGFKAGVGAAVIGFATAIFGLALFPIHNASGAVYFTLLLVMFGASLIFLLVASIRYIWDRSHSNH